jgi:hypothetical protein
MGNQLFIYAMARVLKEQYGKEKIYINTWKNDYHGTKNALINYELDDVEYYSGQLRRLQNETKSSWFQSLLLTQKYAANCGMNFTQVAEYEKKHKWLYDKCGVLLCRDRYEDYSGLANKPSILISGYFQSEKYFDHIREDLLRLYVPRYPLLEKNKELYSMIQQTESVCVSVRLDDDFKNDSIYNVCTPEYYIRAIQYLNERLKNPVFYIFSDRTDRTKAIFRNLNVKMVFESGNDPDYEKLRIMSGCKHFILANSSFSWWCQYLSNHERKMVVAPSRWYNGEFFSDIYCSDWVLIDP